MLFEKDSKGVLKGTMFTYIFPISVGQLSPEQMSTAQQATQEQDAGLF